MATLALGFAGSAIGGSIGGTILGVSAATIGGVVGSAVGSVVDSFIVSSLAPAQRIEGARLDSLRITSSTEGAVIPRVFGRMRMGGNIIWATDFREETRTSTSGGGKGGSPKVKTTEHLYFASFAVAISEGPITGIGRIWADGKPMDITGVTWRWYPGDEAQLPDPFIMAKMGAASTPAYRGTAYIVFEELPLARFGNRLPQLSFEVFAPVADPDTAEGLVRAVTMIPASGEFVYATEGIRKAAFDSSDPDNLHALADTADMVVSLDHLQASMPAVESVSLVTAWVSDDLRAGECTIRPGVELASKATRPETWVVNGVTRAKARLVSRDAEDRPNFGGTPADFAVVQAIRELRSRGLRVTLSPFLLMDVPPGNARPNPYSDDAAETGQPAFPWRGRITCSPAAGFAGTVDKTATAAAQVAAFFGSASPSDFAILGERVIWTGAAGDWGLRRMILHYAHLCAVAGGVDAFLIGSEMRGLTTIRSGASSYPAVQAYRDLLADVRSILGASTRIGYAADWSEYFGHHAAPGEMLEGGVFDDPAAGAHWTQSPLNAAVIDYTAAGLELTPASTAFSDRAQAFQLVATVPGVAYEIRVSVLEVPTDDFRLYVLPLDPSAGLALIGTEADYRAMAAGDYLFTFTAPSTSTALYFRLFNTTDTARIASISLKPASGDVFFHLDPLWADPDIDFVGIDNYMPLSDWRDGFTHLDAQGGWRAIHDRAYLQSNIAGGEGFEWFYASPADRAAQIRTPILDTASVFAAITPARSFSETSGSTITDDDFGGVTRNSDAAFSARVPLPANPTDGVLFERGGSGRGMLLGLRDGGTVFRYRAGLGSVTAPDNETAFLDIPVANIPFDGEEHELVWDVTMATGTIRLWCDGILLGSAATTDGDLLSWAGGGSGSYGASGPGATNITGEPTTGWPVPVPNPLLMYDQAITLDSGNTDWVFRPKDLRAWWSNTHHDRPNGNALMQPTGWVPESKPIWFTELGCPAIDRGTNQPNVFFDPKSSESTVPHFSRGWRDDAIQRAYLEATYLWWGEAANNPVSSVYGGPMVHVPECAAWTWDARPYPFFPELSDVWTDAPNWRLGHWLSGRLGAVSLGALVRALCARAGLPESQIDVSDLWGAVEGYAITALESPRASIAPLARHFGFDVVETEGVIRLKMRGRAAVASIAPDNLVAPREGDVLELTRAQETELPQSLKWQVARSDGDYDAALVEARRITVDSARIASETFPMAVPPEEAERRARRALMEAWIGREGAAFSLPPSRLALDPADVVVLAHDGREVALRLVSIADAEARGIEAVRQDREAYDLPPGQARPSALSKAVVFGPPLAVLMDLPQLTEDQPAHRPVAAAHAVP